MKTYFVLDKNECVDVREGLYERNFPSESAEAIDEKLFVVRYCSATFNKYLIGDLVFHSDLINRVSYLDHAVSASISSIMVQNQTSTSIQKDHQRDSRSGSQI